MGNPKITVIGAGSYFFGKQIIHKMARSEVLAGGTLALVDTNAEVLSTMKRLAQRVFAETKCGVEVMAATERREVLTDSDFVVLTFADRNAHFRGLDTRIAAKHGMRMCSSDTIGPGGIFRALRETPHAVQMAKDVAELAGEAWLINFVNPATVLGIALQRFVPQVKSFALCDGHHEPHNTLMWCKTVGILPKEAQEIPKDVAGKLDLAIGGVNHATFMIRFSYDGNDLLPTVHDVFVKRAARERKDPQEKSKPRFNAHYALQLFDLYGALPTAVSHTKEYVPFFQGYGVAPVEPEPLRLFDGGQRAAEMASAWDRAQDFASGRLSVDTFLGEVDDDHASDIIESMWGKLGKSFYINAANRGAITNMPDDAFVELRGPVDMANGPAIRDFGAFPRGLLALQHQVLDTHELTAQAAVTHDRSILRRALLTDPICNNIADADNCIAELLEAERDALPAAWFSN